MLLLPHSLLLLHLFPANRFCLFQNKKQKGDAPDQSRFLTETLDPRKKQPEFVFRAAGWNVHDCILKVKQDWIIFLSGCQQIPEYSPLHKQIAP